MKVYLLMWYPIKLNILYTNLNWWDISWLRHENKSSHQSSWKRNCFWTTNYIKANSFEGSKNDVSPNTYVDKLRFS